MSNKLNWWTKRKLANAAVKAMEESIVKEAEKQARMNSILQTNDFAGVIQDLFNMCTVPGQQVIITMANGHKIEITKHSTETDIFRTIDKPFF